MIQARPPRLGPLTPVVLIRVASSLTITRAFTSVTHPDSYPVQVSSTRLVKIDSHINFEYKGCASDQGWSRHNNTGADFNVSVMKGVSPVNGDSLQACPPRC